jgi:hypothetical protein
MNYDNSIISFRRGILKKSMEERGLFAKSVQFFYIGCFWSYDFFCFSLEALNDTYVEYD